MKIKNSKTRSFDANKFINQSIENIKEQVGKEKVLCALSGGVDSSVMAVILHKAIGNQLVCFHVDTGLMRANESKNVVKLFKENFKIKVHLINAQKDFFAKLKGVKDPEKKRMIIGKLYVDLFEKEAKKISSCKWLAQGTIYPDVLESLNKSGKIIKSHHNVGGLPKKMKLKIIEPFRELFKPEVRQIGLKLNVPKEYIERHAFPGPGLGVRVVGEVTPEKISILQNADAILTDELRKAKLYTSMWQGFVVLLPVQSTGIKNSNRTFDYSCVIRAVNSTDAMTAEWVEIPYNVLSKISTRICKEVKGINRVVYDITNKPPATIEWE